MRASPSRSAGFTVVELLSVVTVIAALVSLFLPAIQQARESARQIQCRNNLKQLGLALHNYHDQHNIFPRICFEGSGGGSGEKTGWQGFSAHTMLLPQLDHATLYQSIDLDRYALTGSPNDTLKNQTLSTFRCPSDHGWVRTEGAGNNYVVSGGPSLLMISPVPGIEAGGTPGTAIQERNQIGMFNMRRSISWRHLTDGTSHTIAMAEAIIGDNDLSQYRLGDLVRGTSFPTGFPETFASADQLESFANRCQENVSSHYSSCHKEWINGMPGQTAFNTLNPPNSSRPDCHECTTCGWYDSRGVWTSRSRHSGGVNVLLADGAVRFLGNSIDLITWQRLGSISDGWPTGPF
ncbi:MAG TPA: DUF1559 domain-containing protein [Planctomicrobium sp.]|nr:DUF1559 domain-containing protein [Planctomicrobium sp.]